MHTWLHLGLLLAVAITLVSLARRLPLQNVVLAICIIGGIAWSMEALRTSSPGISGERQIWITPMLWIVLIINSRDVARLILRRWRHGYCYGFGVIGLAFILASALDLGFEWKFAHRHIDWKDIGFSALTALISLISATPALLSKKPETLPSHRSITGPEERYGKAANK